MPKRSVLYVLLAVAAAHFPESAAFGQAKHRMYAPPRSQEIVSYTTTFNERKARTEIRVHLGTALKKDITLPISDAPKFRKIEWSSAVTSSLPLGTFILPDGIEGAPQIPVFTVSIVVPADAVNIQPYISKKRSRLLEEVILPPNPFTLDSGKSEYRYVPSLYQNVKQIQKITISEVRSIRSMRFVTLQIPLAEFDAVRSQTDVLEEFHCGITYTTNTKNITRRAVRDPYFAQVYQSLVVNTSDISDFLASPHRTRSSQQAQGFDSVRTFDMSFVSWIDRSAPYIKLSITRDGLYRVTSAQLQSVFNITGWKASEIRLINKGSEVPLWVDTTANGNISAIEFYGERQRGFTNEYYNVITDTNAYWLTNSTKSTEPPKRFTAEQISTPASSVISDGVVRYHHERDLDYYSGDAVADQSQTMHRTEWIPGERFIWKQMKKDDVVFDTLRLPAIPPELANRTAIVEMFVRGISVSPHSAALIINGTTYIETGFQRFDSVVLRAEIPLSELREGANPIEIRHRVADVNIDQWYLDYIRFTLPQSLNASVDTAVAKGQYDTRINAPSGVYDLKFLATEPLSVYSLSENKRLMTESVGSAGERLYRSESSAGEKRIVAAAISSMRTVDRISVWNTSGQSKWNDILDTLQGADYIIITHPQFLSASRKLELRRKQAGLRTKVVTTDEIYNAFFFGSDDPWAMRRFLHYAFDFYNGTPPSLVTIMGDASWDPKFNKNNTTLPVDDRSIHPSFVHSFGIPSSDYIFTTVEGSGSVDSLMPDMIIGRIPVESEQEAEEFITKLVDYESQPPADWNRNNLFVIGGDEGFEHRILVDFLDSFLYSIDFGGLTMPPINVRATSILRTDFSSMIDISHVSEIQTAFRRGQSLAYFFGHGATFTTDVFFGDPTSYRNAGLYPVFITLSCRTGAFTEPNQITLNEAFLRTVGGGVILANGSTGFDERNYVFRYSFHLFNLLRSDRSNWITQTGGAHKISMPAVLTTAKLIASLVDNVSGLAYSWLNSLYQHSILGDAAMGYVFRPQPEFNITAAAVTLSDRTGTSKNVFSILDSFIVVNAKIANFGYSADSNVHIRFRIEQNSGRQFVLFDTLPRLDTSSVVTIHIPLDTFSIGTNILRITVDNPNAYSETNESDNEAVVTYFVNGLSAAPFFPPDASRNMCAVTPDSVTFLAVLPLQSSGGTVEFEADISSSFPNPKRFASLSSSGFFAEITAARSALPQPSDGVMWWRSRIVPLAGDPTTWMIQSVDLRGGGKPMLSLSSPEQLERNVVSGLQYSSAERGLVISSNDTLVYTIISHGADDINSTKFPVSLIYIGSRPIAQYADFGIAAAVLTDDGSGIENNTLHIFPQVGYDSLNTEPLIRSFDSLVSSLPDGRRCIIFTNGQPVIPYFAFRPEVRNAMLSLGSAKGFDTLQFFGSYVLLGRKGAAPGSVVEKFGARFSDGLEVKDTIITSGKRGVLRTPFSLVSDRFGKVRWSSSAVTDDSSLVISVIGVPRSGGSQKVIRRFTAHNTNEFDISSIDAREFTNIALETELMRESAVMPSPVLKSIEFEYDPSAEYFFENQRLSIIPDTILEEGNRAFIEYTVRNILCVDGANVPMQLTGIHSGKADTLNRRTILVFGGRSAMTFRDTIETQGKSGKVDLVAAINPGAAVNEQYLFNNTASGTLTVVRDSIKPRIDLLFDKIRINNGDYVSKNVEIRIRLNDNSPLRSVDTSTLEGVLLPLKQGGQPTFFNGKIQQPDFLTTYYSYPTGEIYSELVILPQKPLAAGRYLISARAKDASGNAADTITREFIISALNGLEKVMNYPNPFKNATFITFLLKSDTESDVQCHIYTVAGRKIRTLTLDKSRRRVGLNSIEWDGRDADGNELANGTYLYRVVLRSHNDDGSESTDAVTEKAVKSR